MLFYRGDQHGQRNGTAGNNEGSANGTEQLAQTATGTVRISQIDLPKALQTKNQTGKCPNDPQAGKNSWQMLVELCAQRGVHQRLFRKKSIGH